MGELPQTAPAPPSPDNTEPLVCPHCGYDLRQSPGDLCSECGHAIDRSILATSNFPWPHRRHKGRIRAFCQMLWLISIDSKQHRYEFARPQLLADGRAFRKFLAVTLAIAFIAIAVILIGWHHGLDFLAVPRPSNLSNAPPRRSLGWLADVAIPWSTAATMLPTWPLMLTLLAIYLTTVQQRLFRINDASPRLQERAFTIGYYSAATLGFLLPLILLWATMLWLFIWQMVATTNPNLITAMSPLVFVAVVPPLALVRIVQWSLRVTNRGTEYSLLLIPRLLAYWFLGLIVFLGILPWCIGFLWLVIDSFR